MAARLAHVCFESTDLEATEHFYGLLGIERQFEFRNLQGELVGFYLSFDNESYVEVIKVATAAMPGLIRHFAIEVDNIDDAYDALVAGGVEVSKKEWASDNNWMITCHDPDGVYIELQQYTEESMQRVGGVCEVDYRP